MADIVAGEVDRDSARNGEAGHVTIRTCAWRTYKLGFVCGFEEQPSMLGLT